MKILHTADWHLGDRLGRIDRTEDLRRAVERVAEHCEREHVDVLLVAGDLFSELARPDALRDTIRHWQDVFHRFLHGGGTILTLTGNHDNESFCRTLTHAMNLAAPLPSDPGAVVPTGRLYLATEPTLLRLPDHAHDSLVQFLLLPYPTPARYLRDETTQRYTSVEEKNRQLQTACLQAMQALRQHDRFDASLPAVLSAHVHVRGANFGASLFRLSEEDDVILDEAALSSGFAYVALGHIHRAQAINGQAQIRYSGSIEKMDLGESHDAKGVVVVDIGRDGRRGDPELLPLPATNIYEVQVRNPSAEIPQLRVDYAGAQNDLVNIHLTYTAGVDNLEDTLRQLEEIFPRWYNRDWTETSMLGPSLSGEGSRAKSFAETVREYLDQELMNHSEEEREAIFARAEQLIKELEGE